ncbi:Alpha/beta hydrolase fold-1 [Mycena alexandri]|uniref:Alpha/beta hydrolase fold-1 n=1 Tax=Mycena alexandri TaxID=1745969 RepID=A0AAD6XFS9_9AGAR|nr:Alpha/beta hydrolase fold-1 [Mycena alexandri]
MKTQVYISEPSPTCPFRVEAAQYTPVTPAGDGLTLVFLHAMSLHKETFAPMIDHFLAAASTSIKDVWSIENPNHGRSSVLNQELLAGPSYREYWSAAEYARATYSFLTSPAHGVDFSTRRIIGLAHSSAVSVLMMLIHEEEFSSEKKPLQFTSIILLDPALLPPEFPSTKILSSMFGKFASTKREKWPTRAAARQYLAVHPAFKAWDPRALQLFVECALREGSGSDVVLSCSRAQEAAFYLSPTTDFKARPVEIFTKLVRADALPIHLITCLKDEYKGQTRPSKEFQIAQIRSAARGSVQLLDRGGHMFPQVEPALCAEAIQRALSGETKARL